MKSLLISRKLGDSRKFHAREYYDQMAGNLCFSKFCENTLHANCLCQAIAKSSCREYFLLYSMRKCYVQYVPDFAWDGSDWIRLVFAHLLLFNCEAPILQYCIVSKVSPLFIVRP